MTKKIIKFFLCSLSINLCAYQSKAELIIAVLDTGIEESHPYFKEKLFLIKGHDIKDENSHGTHVSGIIAKRIDNSIKIMPIKIIQEQKLNSKEFLKKSIKLAIDNGAKIVNISGTSKIYYPEDKAFIEKNKNVLFVVASSNIKNLDQGTIDLDIILRMNMPTNPLNSLPCGYYLPNVICVGNAYYNGKKLKVMSDYGSKVVDIFANGMNVNSSILHGKEGLMSGTSMATPKITALLANEWNKHPELSIENLKKAVFTQKYDSELKKICKTGILLKD